MNSASVGLLAVLLTFGTFGCATSARKGSAQAGQNLLIEDQKKIEEANAAYKDAILQHGESSDEAVKAKTALDNAKNNYMADQTHVQQLQRMEAQPNPVDSSTHPAGQPGSMNTPTGY
jgi:hypothetical protein